MIGKVELDSTFPIIQTVYRRSPQTPGTDISICLGRCADLSAIVSQIDRRPLETRLKPGQRQRQNATPKYNSALSQVFRKLLRANYHVTG